MSCSASQFLTFFFDELEKRGIPHVVIHSYEALPEETSTDVDYAVFERDVPKIRPIQLELARRHGWALAQTLRHGVFAFYTVMVSRENPRENLKLDLCSNYARARRFLVSEKILLEGRRKFRGFYIPAPAAEFIYTVTKLFDAKHKSPADYIPRLRELWGQQPEDAQKYFTQVFGDTGLTLAQWFGQPPEKWHELRGIMLSRNRFGAWLNVREVFRIAGRFLRPTGTFITVLGPDGAGKSTLLENLSVILEPCFRKERLFHFRPMLFQKKGPGVANPHADPPRGALAGWVKIFYYFTDWWLGWLLVILPAKARSTLVLFDRGFDDLVVDPKRYRIRPKCTLARLLRHFMPHADATFVLDADPEIIHARKPELPLKELEQQRAAYRKLASADPRWHLINADQPPEEVARAVSREVVAFLATRFEKRTAD